MKSRFSDRVRHVAYAPVLAFSMGLMLLRLLLMARILDVPNFAQFSGGLLVSSTFCMLGCLGLQFMLQRDLPMMIVHCRERHGLILVAQCLIVAFVCALIGILAVGIISPIGDLLPAILFVGVLHGFSQQIFLVITVESRSRGEPFRFAMQNLVRSVLIVSVGFIVAIFTESAVYTLIAELLLSIFLVHNMLRTMFRNAVLPISVASRAALNQLKDIPWSSALALLSVGVVSFILLNIDRWIAAEILNTIEFAQYSFAWMVLMVAQSFQVIISASLFPSLARRFASDGRPATFSMSAKVSIIMLLAGGIFAVPIWFALREIISHWFPAYEIALPLLPLFLAIAALRVSDYWTSYMIIAGLERRLLWLNLITAFGGISLWLFVDKIFTKNFDQLQSIGILAVILTLVSYLLTAGAAWQAAKK